MSKIGEPDIKGRAGRAWRFRISDDERVFKPHGLDAYVIYQPGVHAFWSWWWVTGCDLYPDDSIEWGRQPAKKRKPENTHEWMAFALSPESGYYARSKDTPPDGWDSTDEDNPERVGRHFMTPVEFVYQDVLRDNDQANEVLRLLVKAMCDGITLADADFRSRNVEMLAATCAHFRAGKHDIE